MIGSDNGWMNRGGHRQMFAQWHIAKHQTMTNCVNLNCHASL